MKHFSNWLLRQLIPDHFIEDIIGDMEEEHSNILSSTSRLQADWYYFKDTISLIFSYAIKKRKEDHTASPYTTTQNSIPMLRNYFKVAIRSLKKQPLFTGINILGLAAGMSIGLLFIAMISFIYTYDDFHENKDQIHRIISKTDDQIRTNLYASSPAPLAQLLKTNHTGFGQVTRINKSLNGEAEYLGRKLPINGLFVDDNFLDVFTFDMLEGDQSLQNPEGILLTESYAYKLFSNNDPIGETISLGNMGDFIVAGIMKDIPNNSHMWFEALLPYKTLVNLHEKKKIHTNLNDWENFNNNYAYMRLQEGSDLDALSGVVNQIAEDKYENIEQFNALFKIQEMSEIAIGSDTKNELGTAWGTEIYFISILNTLLILLPACFNYANISTAKALHRAKEIGMRKVVGGVKKQIFMQFILETVIVSLVSLLGAFFIFTLIRYEFQTLLMHGSRSLDFQITTPIVIYSITFALLTGIMAGIFPAIHFSGIKPINALKKTAKSQILGKVNFQKTLIVIQFALSFGFIMGVVVLVDQYQTILNHDLGFKQENILDIPIQNTDSEILRASLDKLAAVQQVSMSSEVLGVNSNNQMWLPVEDDSMSVTQLFIDHNYIKNLELQLLAGTGFMRVNTPNEQFTVVNEDFITKKGFDKPDEALGEFVHINDSTDLKIIGVVSNFHFQDLSRKIEPLIFRNNSSHFYYANAKIISKDIHKTLSDIEMEWNKISDQKFEAKFFSDEIDEAFDIYSTLLKIFGFLGFLAITISCLGLLGMVVFTTQSRIKEVGIRKVMGAPIAQITYLLTKDFLKLMIIGSLISIPLSYILYSMIISRQNLYSESIGVLPVIISLFILMALGLLTVTSETLRAARSNPSDTLRSE